MLLDADWGFGEGWVGFGGDLRRVLLSTELGSMAYWVWAVTTAARRPVAMIDFMMGMLVEVVFLVR